MRADQIWVFSAALSGEKAVTHPTIQSLLNAMLLQDAVARGGKFLTLYKRPGQRVIINRFGDLIVRPSFAEASYQRVLFGGLTCLFRGRYVSSSMQCCVPLCAQQMLSMQHATCSATST